MLRGQAAAASAVAAAEAICAITLRLLYDVDNNQSSMYIIFIDFHLILLKRIQVEFSQIEIEM